jgi:hypothetical protein
VGETRSADYVTIGYSSGTGARLWARRYHGPVKGFGEDGAAAVAVGPGGGRVFVTGSSFANSTSYDYATIAYSS